MLEILPYIFAGKAELTIIMSISQNNVKIYKSRFVILKTNVEFLLSRFCYSVGFM